MAPENEIAAIEEQRRQLEARLRELRQSGLTQALFKAFEALAVCAEGVMERAKHELTAQEFLELLDRMAASAIRRARRWHWPAGATACTADGLGRFNITHVKKRYHAIEI